MSVSDERETWGPEEPDDAAPLDLDQEWAAINHDLDKQLDVRIEDLEEQEKYSAIVDEVFDRFSMCDTMRVLDVDDHREQELRRDFLETLRRTKMARIEEQRQWSESEVTVEDHIAALQECLIEYDEQRDFEALLIRDVALLVFSERFPNDFEVSPVLDENRKKHLQAAMAVARQYDPDHPLQRFVDEVAPGSRSLQYYIYLDDDMQKQVGVLDPDDERYITSAKENFDEQKALAKRKRWLMREARQVIGLTDSEENIDRILDVTMTFIKMYIVSTWTAYSAAAQLKKKNALWEVAREQEYSDDVLCQVVDLFYESGSF